MLKVLKFKWLLKKSDFFGMANGERRYKTGSSSTLCGRYVASQYSPLPQVSPSVPSNDWSRARRTPDGLPSRRPLRRLASRPPVPKGSLPVIGSPVRIRWPRLRCGSSWRGRKRGRCGCFNSSTRIAVCVIRAYARSRRTRTALGECGRCTPRAWNSCSESRHRNGVAGLVDSKTRGSYRKRRA